jgi:hypothetical protein
MVQNIYARITSSIGKTSIENEQMIKLINSTTGLFLMGFWIYGMFIMGTIFYFSGAMIRSLLMAVLAY